MSTKSNCVKTLLIMLFILTGIVVIGLIVLNSPEKTKRICTSKSCISAANLIIQNMNMSVDPCQDFHEFSCGTFIQTKRIPDDRPRLDIFDGLRDSLAYQLADLLSEPILKHDIESIVKAKILFSSCMNEEKIEKDGEQIVLNHIQNELGGWNILNGEDSKSNLVLMDKLIKLRLLNAKIFFDLSVTANLKNPTLSVLRLKQPSWLLNREIYNDKRVILVLKNVVLKTLQLMNLTSKSLSDEVDRMIELEKKLGLNQGDETLKRGYSFKNITIKSLQENLPGFDWFQYISGVYKSDQINYPNISLNETIIVDDYVYLENFSKLYANYITNNKTNDLDNFSIWIYLRERIQFLPKKFREVKLEMDKVIKGAKSIPPISLSCSEFLTESLEYIVGRMYVAKYFDNKAKDSATQMIINIQNELKVILKEVDWMDDESRAKALEKAESIEIKIGYPNWLHNDSHLNSLYKHYNFSETAYFANQIQISKMNVAKSFLELRKIRDIKDWFIGPAVVNAFYSPAANQICFPAGILQEPFFDGSYPKYLNYGAIGTVIGHEITHGFDDKGRMFDKNGVFNSDSENGLMTNETVRKFKKKVECLIQQYNNFTVKQINITLNGLQTSGENIADNGGIKEAFRAYKKWALTNGPEELLPGLDKYSQEQLFFIHYGQIWCGKFRDQYLKSRLISSQHSPGEFRVIGPTSNLDEFAIAFNCKKGQRNNPVEKCSVW